MLMDVCDRELIRLNDLREHHVDTDGALLPWLDHEIGEVQRRRDWFLKARASRARNERWLIDVSHNMDLPSPDLAKAQAALSQPA
jgi:hypothetical protein